MRAPLALLLLVGCASPGATQAAMAAANVGMATAVGGARMASGDCFTICGPGTICNPKTKACDALPCHDQCKPEERCDTTGAVDRCVPGGQMEVKQKQQPAPASSVSVGTAPPLSSAPSSSPEHPDVPTR